MNITEILNHRGATMVDDIRGLLASSGTNATGKTSESVGYEVKEANGTLTLTIFGREYFASVETGRGPRKSAKQSGFADSMLEWMKAKGVGSELDDKKRKGLARFLTLKANREGSALYRKGGRKDIFSPVVNKSAIEAITQEVLDSFANLIVTGFKTWR